MARSIQRNGLSQIALEYAGITAIGLSIVMIFVGYPRRGAELLIAGAALFLLKSLLRRMSDRRSSREVYRNVVLVNSDGRQLRSKLLHLTHEGGFTLGEAGEQLRVGEQIQIRVDHFEARGRIGWVNGGWAGGEFTNDEQLLPAPRLGLRSV